MNEILTGDETEQAQKKFNDLLDFSYLGQDWDLVNANDLRLKEFIDCYRNHANTEEEKIELMGLILVSLDDYLAENPHDLKFWEIVKPILREDEEIFLGLIVYWSALDISPNFVWQLTPLIRETFPI